MGSNRVWLIVEGRVSDRPFYERLLAAHPDARDAGYSIRLAEEIELEGRTGGGKPFALKLFDFFDREGLLVQHANEGPKSIAFALDRDLDHLSPDARTSDFVFYTSYADVEAEILLNGDLQRALGSAFSLDSERVREVIPSGESIGSSLAELWREWIIFGAVAVGCAIQSEFRYGRPSKINTGTYGQVDQTKRDRLRSDLEARLAAEGRADELARLEQDVLSIFDAGDGHLLVKGKWLATYAEHRLRIGLSDVPIEASVQVGTVTKTCLETLNFEDGWAGRFHSFVDDLLLAA